ncbi:hypothetical protein [Streptomyces sp. NBC_01304]|uniref:hypothetical protein n=1 Tax=Streptomyces sp. NBC_01304 TaxID=2903818 RepID=UPI002E164878|nr:hypothetical protein OG430_47755 [Streptomyces sp. NBC_01304]
MYVITRGQAAAVAAGFAASSPLGGLAQGRLPDCFAHVRQQVYEALHDCRATEGYLAMEDGPADPFMESGQLEMAEMSQSLGRLRTWVEAQRCTVTVCACRADRMLRQLLKEAGIPAELGFSRKLQRYNCVIAGDYVADPGEGSVAPYVLIEHRNHIDHAVRYHRGWRVRRSTPGGVEVLYESPGYPQSPVGAYEDDTRSCVRAVGSALRLHVRGE